jgi:hypothetical protein
MTAVKCTAAESLAKLARSLGWEVEVRYAEGELDYTHKGDPKPDGGNFAVKVAEPVSSAGVYARRGVHRLAAWYAARQLPERRTPTGALSWSLDGAIGRKLVGSGETGGWTPTAFAQATEKGMDKKGRSVTRPVGPTTKAQVEAYLAEHGEAPAPAQPELTIDLGPARPNWSAAA